MRAPQGGGLRLRLVTRLRVRQQNQSVGSPIRFTRRIRGASRPRSQPCACLCWSERRAVSGSASGLGQFRWGGGGCGNSRICKFGRHSCRAFHRSSPPGQEKRAALVEGKEIADDEKSARAGEGKQGQVETKKPGCVSSTTLATAAHCAAEYRPERRPNGRHSTSNEH